MSGDHFVSVRAIAAVAMIATLSACGGAPLRPSPDVVLTLTDQRVGSGAEATVGKILTVNYTGWLYDESKADKKGTQFDTSTGRGAFTFQLGVGSVIRGWDQGVAGMRVGGLRQLIIPSNLAYGSTGGGNGVIPPNTPLVFDIELLGVQ
jgi:FKBP-type peptidyl-prolyl cis-trans isomerase FkpA